MACKRRLQRQTASGLLSGEPGPADMGRQWREGPAAPQGGQAAGSGQSIPAVGVRGGRRWWEKAQSQPLAYAFPRSMCQSRESRPDGTDSPAGRTGLGRRRLSQGDALSRATLFSCITSVPCSLPTKAVLPQAPSQSLSQLCLTPHLCSHLPWWGSNPRTLLSSEEGKLFTDCSGSRLPWGCQMYLVVIGTLLPWLCGCCAWQRQGWSIRKSVYTGRGGSQRDLNPLSRGEGRIQPSLQAQAQGAEAGDHGHHNGKAHPAR